MIILFWRGRLMDYQAIYSNNNKINRRYIDFGNYNFGVVAAAAGYSLEESLLAAGIVNLTGTGRNDGAMYNNPRNAYFIRRGYDDFVHERVGM